MPWFDWIGAAAALIICGYIAYRYEALDLRNRHVADRRRGRQRHPAVVGIGSDAALFRRRAGRPDFDPVALRFHRTAYAGRFRHPAGIASPADHVPRARHQRHDRHHPVGGDADRHSVHTHGPGARPHRRCRLFRRSGDVGDGPIPRRRRQNRRVRLGAVRHDLRRRGEQRGGGRHRHDPLDVAFGIFAARARQPSKPSARPAAS